MQLFTAKAWESVTRDAIRQVYRGFRSGVGLRLLRECKASISGLIMKQSPILIACSGALEFMVIRLKQPLFERSKLNFIIVDALCMRHEPNDARVYQLLRAPWCHTTPRYSQWRCSCNRCYLRCQFSIIAAVRSGFGETCRSSHTWNVPEADQSAFVPIKKSSATHFIGIILKND